MSDLKKPQPMPTGPERELQIYTLGLSGGKPSVPVPLDLLEQKAKEILAPRAYDYVAGGAGGGDTMRANRAGFYPGRVVPRAARGVSEPALSGGWRGARVPAPGVLGAGGGEVWGIMSGTRFLAGCWRNRRSRIRWRRSSFGAACFRIRRSRGRISDFCGSTRGCRSSSKEYCVPMMRRGRWRRGWTR